MLSQASTGLNLADLGWERCNPPRGSVCWWDQLLGGYGCARREAMVNVHGVTMARPQGQSGAPHPSSEQQ